MLNIKNLTFVVNTDGVDRKLFDDFSYEFHNGKNYVITGANGCGKSTLAKIIMGIVPIQHGKIIYNGVDISRLSITERANLGIAFAMQHPVKFKGLKTKDIINYAFHTQASASMACEHLSKVGLCARNYLERDLNSSLSGGELKRIEIATVLARNCSLNIFDEPEAGIDIWSFNNLVDIFQNIRSSQNINIIISHQEKIFASADEIILIDEGRVAMSGQPSEVLPHISNYKTCAKIKESTDEYR